MKLFLNFKQFRNFLLTRKFKYSEKFQTFTAEINTPVFYQWSRTKHWRENLFSECKDFYFSSVKIQEQNSAVLIKFQSQNLNPNAEVLVLKNMPNNLEIRVGKLVYKQQLMFWFLSRKTSRIRTIRIYVLCVENCVKFVQYRFLKFWANSSSISMQNLSWNLCIILLGFCSVQFSFFLPLFVVRKPSKIVPLLKNCVESLSSISVQTIFSGFSLSCWFRNHFKTLTLLVFSLFKNLSWRWT